MEIKSDLLNRIQESENKVKESSLSEEAQAQYQDAKQNIIKQIETGDKQSIIAFEKAEMLNAQTSLSNKDFMIIGVILSLLHAIFSMFDF